MKDTNSVKITRKQKSGNLLQEIEHYANPNIQFLFIPWKIYQTIILS